jgi:ribosome-associated protein
MASDLYINPQLTIPGADLSWTAVRSSGPGGQNVNKVASKVDLRFDVDACVVLSAAVKRRLRAIARVDAGGRIVITSQVTRNRVRNLEDARDRLADMIRQALIEPKRRRKTKPSRAVNRRRLEAKQRQSQKKRQRRFSDSD